MLISSKNSSQLEVIHSYFNSIWFCAHLPHFEVSILFSRKFHNTSKCKITSAKHITLPQGSDYLFQDCIPKKTGLWAPDCYAGAVRVVVTLKFWQRKHYTLLWGLFISFSKRPRAHAKNQMQHMEFFTMKGQEISTFSWDFLFWEGCFPEEHLWKFHTKFRVHAVPSNTELLEHCQGNLFMYFIMKIIDW